LVLPQGQGQPLSPPPIARDRLPQDHGPPEGHQHHHFAFGQATVAAAFLAPQVPFDPLKPHDNLAQQRDGVASSEKRAGGVIG
jgi:hypothetical protein